MLKNTRVFQIVGVFAGIFLLSAANGVKAGPVFFDVIQPGEKNWGAWRCVPNGSAKDTVHPFPNATSTIEIRQINDQSHIKIKVRNAAPNRLWSVWFLHIGSFNPLRGRKTPVMAMINPPEIVKAIKTTPVVDLVKALKPYGDAKSKGTQDTSDLFRTDSQGNGEWEKWMNFTVIKGAYPYNETSKLIKKAFGVTIKGLKPLPTSYKPNRTKISVVSHCDDDAGHGITSYKDERWFQLRKNPFTQAN